MWFMNKIANPFVRALLRSPLHSLMSASLLLITYRGTKSVKEYTLPVQYTRHEQTIYIIPGMPKTKTWWRNLREGAPVTLILRGKSVTGQATLLEGEADTSSIIRALASSLKRFPAAAKYYAVKMKEDGSPDENSLLRAAQSTVAVRVELDQG